MKFFSDANEVIQFSREFVKNRINSLEKDVKYCIMEINSHIQYAPFPALLYCFSTIDLLGSLLEGDASRKAEFCRIYIYFTEHLQLINSQLIERYYFNSNSKLLQVKFSNCAT